MKTQKKLGKWHKLSSRTVFKSVRFNVLEDKVLRPDGSPGKYFIITSGPGVVVIPFDGEKIYMINQFRYAVQQRCWELPAGRAENKNYLSQAKKELGEETGILAKKWNYLGEFTPSNGTSNRRGRIYLAQNLEFGQPNREAGEADMAMQAFTLKELDAMIAAGKILDGWTIVSLYYFKLFFNL